MRTPAFGNSYPRRHNPLPLRNAPALLPTLNEDELSKIELPELFLKHKSNNKTCDIIFTDEWAVVAVKHNIHLKLTSWFRVLFSRLRGTLLVFLVVSVCAVVRGCRGHTVRIVCPRHTNLTIADAITHLMQHTLCRRWRRLFALDLTILSSRRSYRICLLIVRV